MSGLPLKLIGSIIGVLLIFGAGFMLAHKIDAGRYNHLLAQVAQARADANAATQKADQKNREAEQEAQKVSDAVAKVAQLTKQAQDAAANVVTKEVIKYVQNPHAAVCSLPVEWVRIHNQAAAGAASAVPNDAGATGGIDAGTGAIAIHFEKVTHHQ